MTKKKKIIIGITSLFLAIVLITSALIVILADKFRIKTFNDINYVNHTTARAITLDSQYKRTYADTHYENGSEIIENNSGKYGLFSNISGSIVVPTAFDRYRHLNTNKETNKSYFKFYNTGQDKDGFIIYDEHGTQVFKTSAENNYTGVNEMTIKSKTIDVDDDYEIEDTYKSIKVENITFGNTYYKEGKYHYESWIITDKEGREYTNLYSIEDDKRKLIQTIGETIGEQIDHNENFNQKIQFLSDGTPIFVTQNIKTISTNNNVLEIKIYDLDFELENKVVIKDYDHITCDFRIEDSLFIQQIFESSEDDYDFLANNEGTTYYYKLKTHKINLKSGRHNEIKTKLFVQNTINTTGALNEFSFNVDNNILNTYVIENKEIESPILVLANDQLKYKEIDYTFNSITKISKNRYLAISKDQKYTLIDKNYDVIADLSKFNDVFTTVDCIIASDNSYTYICNHDGVILKRYTIGSILNVHNSQYYIVIQESEDSSTITYKRGNNGKEFEKLLTLSTTDNDTMVDNLSFNDITPFIGSDYAYLLATKTNGSNSEYTIFNFSGFALYTFQMASQYVTPVHASYDDNLIIKISDYTILLNK